MLQFGHGGEPWRTSNWHEIAGRADVLQFGHGGEPWRTARTDTGLGVMAGLLQFGHGGEPWRTSGAKLKPDSQRRASIRPRR